MFPYRVDNPRLGPAHATAVIVALNIAVWVFAEGMGGEDALLAAVCDFGLIPGRLFGDILPGAAITLGEGVSCTVGAGPVWPTVISSMFMHGGWFHLIGNMWFLWLFGRNVEDVMGAARYVAFYLLAGLAAAAGQLVAQPHSALPMVGASGAISGLMGAYLVLFPRVRVHIWAVLGLLATRANLPAYAMLLYWFAMQILGAQVGALQPEGGGVAFAAHTAGFLTGALLARLFTNPALAARREKWLDTGA